ncbi:MAG: hypothetical protein KGI60_03885 [Patescibacteria group bacterium]|nr:hypothetical protein [Patescibacteria group bacterium]
MPSGPEKLFGELREPAPPYSLYERIVARIQQEVIKAARRRVFFYGAVTLTAVLLFVPALQVAVQSFMQSGTATYLSLLVSDTQLVMSSWQDYLFSITDSLPLFDITLVLAVLFVLLGSLSLALKNNAKLSSLKLKSRS